LGFHPHEIAYLFGSTRNSVKEIMGSVPEQVSVSPQRAVFKGLLFDMDGTIIDSTDAIVKHWHK
jgi:hypothetical protein